MLRLLLEVRLLIENDLYLLEEITKSVMDHIDQNDFKVPNDATFIISHNSEISKPEIEVNGDQKVMDFFPEDINRVQMFNFPEAKTNAKKVRIIFKSSSDFYGRITLYSLELHS